MEWDPANLSQNELHRMRDAAESAWGDDTRHPSYEAHPQPSAGNCFVTSHWMQSKLGGHVGVKGGHYFWVSPDKQYVVDLTGDQFASAPADLRFHGVKLDEGDEGWTPTEDQRRWHPGPILFKRADHPLYKGFRVKPYPDHPRAKLFAERANQAYNNS